MGAAIAKLRPLRRSGSDTIVMYRFWCPGCNEPHAVAVHPGEPQPVWEFNGDLEKPTFSPSIVSYRMEGKKRITLCHSYVRDGKIQFLNDCQHNLAGQTVELPDVD